jgi:phospholipid transport system substrate-binding protein
MVTRVLVLRLLLSILPVLGVIAVSDAAPAAPASPTDELRRHFDQVVSAAQSPQFRRLEPAQRQDVIRRISGRLFDWPEMARRALGAHWAERTVSERRAFAGWFARLAERAYSRQVEHLGTTELGHQPVRFLDERVTGDEAIVHAAVALPRDVPLEFRLHRREGRWRVYDVAADGVSAADNYGAQFRRVIARASYPGLVDQMLVKLGEAPAGPRVVSARR